ncbi:Na(+)-translocating NADH-quinone reductase subunit F [Ulvibacter antarcticus]|uniref:Na(+)-translocating NADH-quinone reductase subunit F n=1 Tax=Ulvibacter antarcticus TaxID=442714 RepID=A0A3L9YEE4_9FLAO|nr:Na(+)-translocating NADH-quinone reductase subunit F [Ulvibacter antarcticus]RMA57827.1 hypothetical protein BXY75_2633 [Ulvibacter antarcticus]
MKSTKRLDLAITKLYTAFHNGTLNPECCKSCAVGNICDNLDSWKHLSDFHGSVELNYVGKINEMFGRRINGYSPSELLQIEAIFLSACGYQIPFGPRSKKPNNPTDKELQFNGLSAVVAFLCELDSVDNSMDYSRLFQYQNNEPLYKLSSIAGFDIIEASNVY